MDGGKVLQQRSRLRKHAPSSIQVGPPSVSLAEWKVAIPLLSPLDIASIPAISLPEAALPGGEASAGGCHGGGRWRHPAEPFCYETTPANATAFVLPHCT
ncbi:Uncharacterized protein AXF42_Ash015262 [Apostasia shenzhenica]|uniref:Uncharacterized protein n=1 Tax=Apostasia shenzhenica TaxID=1088818 RepID=A0A2I0ALR2_9ASPA|nr:Uncharacterized protein AXF42_Ash015262 [Apostasia shenzhenica]